jgi:hypothetical protein
MSASVHGIAHARTGNRPKNGVNKKCQRLMRGCCKLQVLGGSMMQSALQNFRQKYVADAERDTTPAR